MKRIKPAVRWIAGAALLGLVAAAALVLFADYRPRSRRAGVDIDTKRVKPVPEMNWIPGDRRSYRLKIDSRVLLRLPGLSPNQALHQIVEGCFNLRVFEAEHGAVQAGVQIYPMDLAINGMRDEQLAKRLTAPFVVRFADSGEAALFEFPAGLSQTEEQTLQEVVLAFQVVLRKGETRWSTREIHAGGVFLSRYGISPGGVLSKQKTLYLETKFPVEDPEQTATIDILESRGHFELSQRSSWLESAQVQERLVVYQDSEAMADSGLKAELLPLETPLSEPLALFNASDARDVISFQAAIEARQEPEVVPGEGENQQPSITDIITRYEAGAFKRFAFLREMEDRLLSNPEAYQELVEHIQSRTFSDRTQALMIHALERVGTADAQFELIALVNDDRTKTMNKMRAVVALGGLKQPGTEAVDTLIGISRNSLGSFDDDLAHTATLALGAVAGTLCIEDPEQYAKIRNELIDTLQSAASTEDEAIALKAMANMSDSETIPTVASYLSSPSSLVRAGAAEALGGFDSPDFYRLLADRLSEEQNGRVRAALVRGMEWINDATTVELQTINRMILSEPVAEVRLEMTRYLCNHIADHPELERTMKHLVMTDASTEIRLTAFNALREKNRKK